MCVTALQAGDMCLQQVPHLQQAAVHLCTAFSYLIKSGFSPPIGKALVRPYPHPGMNGRPALYEVIAM